MPPRRTQLSSGATVVSELVPGARSVAFGLYFPTGSRHETAANNGVSHMIEHLVFKGTGKRSADQINREIDLLGGASNAYTTKELICFYARVLGEHLPQVVEFLGDLATDGLPDGIEPELEREREVILSEISAVDDSPEELVGDLIDQAYFGEHTLALPIVGSARVVGRLSLNDIRGHYRGHLVAKDLVIAACGKVDHDELVALVEQHLAGLPVGEGARAIEAPEPVGATRFVHRDLEQVQLCLSAPGVSRGDTRRAAADLLNAIAGEGYSSRLFREVRDRRGLAYSVFSGFSSYLDVGSFNVYLAVPVDKLAETLEVVGTVLAELRDGGVTDEELERAKVHVHASSVLSHESTGVRLGHLAEKVLLGEENLEIERDLEELKQVTLADVHSLAAAVLERPLAVAAVGPVTAEQLPEPGWTLPR